MSVYSPIPTFSNSVVRYRLLRELELINDKNVILVIAPSGSGKSTAVAHSAQEFMGASYWFSFTPADCDPRLLDQRLYETLRGSERPPATTLLERARHLQREVANRFTQDSLVVLDGLEALAKSPEAARWLSSFLTDLPHKLHVVLIGNLLPETLPLAHLLSRRQLAIVGGEQLAFRADEAEQLAASYGLALTEEQHAALRQVEYHAASLGLLLHPRFGAPTQHQQNSRESYFYLLRHWLNQLPELLRDFIRQTSLLPDLDAVRAQEILRRGDQEERFAELEALDLPLVDQRGVIRYPDGFQQVLQREYRHSQPHYSRDLLRRLGQWYLNNQQPDKGIETLIDANETEAAARHLEESVRVFQSQGRSTWLERTGDRLQAQAGYRLSMNLAQFALRRNQPERALTYLGYANQRAVEPTQHDAIQVQELHVMLQQSQFDQLTRNGETLLAKIDLVAAQRALTHLYMGQAALHESGRERARYHLNQCIAICEEQGDLQTKAQAHRALAIVEQYDGNFDAAFAQLRQEIDIYQRLNNALERAAAEQFLGYLMHQIGNFTQAQDVLQAALQPVIAIDSVAAQILLRQANLLRDLGQMEAAQQRYSDAMYRSAYQPNLLAEIYLGLSTLYRWLNDGASAIHEIDAAMRFAQQSGDTITRQHVEIERWLVYKMFSEKPLGHLPEMGRALRRDRYFGSRWLVAAWLDEQYDLVDEQFDLFANRLDIQHLLAELAANQPLQQYLYQGIESGHKNWVMLRDRLEAYQPRIQPAAAVSMYDGSLLSIDLIGLRGEHIARNGHNIPLREFKSRLARRMLFYLHFEQEVEIDTLIAILWPDDVPQRPRQQIEQIIYLMHKALNGRVVEKYDSYFQLSDDIPIRSDLMELEAYLYQGELQPAHSPDALKWFEMAAELYDPRVPDGNFLDDHPGPWFDELRRRSRSYYARALMGIGRYHRLGRDFETALSYLDRAIAADPGNEAIQLEAVHTYGSSRQNMGLAEWRDRLMTVYGQTLSARVEEVIESYLRRSLIDGFTLLQRESQIG